MARIPKQRVIFDAEKYDLGEASVALSGNDAHENIGQDAR